MKIGFTGAGGTGKSTTLAALSPHIDAPVLPSVMRDAMDAWRIRDDPHLCELALSTNRHFQAYAWQRRLEQEHQHGEHFISDRTLLDHLAYLIATCGVHALPDDAESYFEATRQNMLSYELVAYFPLTTFQNIGGRRTDPIYHHTVDSLIRGLLTNWGVQYIEMWTPNLDDRATFLHWAIDETRANIYN